MKVLNLSGGSTKFIGIVGATQEIMKTWTPDAMTGVSAGAITMIPAAMGMWDTIIPIGLNVELKTFFKIPPVTKKGKIRTIAAIRALFGKSLGVQRVKELYASIVTPEIFSRYQDGDYPVCYALAVNYQTAEPVAFNLKDKNTSYEKALDAIAASSAIPVFTQPIFIDGQMYYDGGVRDFVASKWAIDNLNPTEVKTVYSRPYGYIPTAELKSSSMSILIRTLDIMQNEVQMNDADTEKSICAYKSISLSQYFLPQILESLYDTDSRRLHTLFMEAKKIIND